MRTDFDYTMLSTFQVCRRKYEYRINRGLVSPKPQTAPAFGGAIHKALDVLYKQVPFSDVDAAVKVFKDNFQESPTDDKRTHKLGEWIINNYFQKYQSQDFKVLEVERSFEIELPNGNKFIGRIDKVIEWDGVVWIMDHKTTSQLGVTYEKTLEPNGQFSGYVYAARQMGYKAAGVVVDAILVAKGLLESSSRGKLSPLLRFMCYRNDRQLQEWLEETVRQHQNIKDCEETGAWPMDGLFNGMCTYYGECPYRRLCVEDNSLRERIINMDYVVERWDPRHKEEGS